MANGRAAAVEARDPLAREPFLAIGEIAGRAASARILLAAPLSLGEIEQIAGASIETMDELSFDRASASLRARRRRRSVRSCSPSRCWRFRRTRRPRWCWRAARCR